MAASSRDGALVGLCLMAMVVLGSIIGAEAQLSDKLTPDFYHKSCPKLFDIVKAGVQKAVAANPRNAASLIRVHFHDCFVQGCDASLLLDNSSNPQFTSEQYSKANNDSIRQLDTIDAIKAEVEAACPRTVSCADIVALASRDAAVAAGLTYIYPVLFGRRDSLRPASIATTNQFLPSPFFSYPDLVQNFKQVFLNEVDLVTLSGAHTVGRVHCPLALAFFGNTSVGFNPAFQEQTNLTCNVTNNAEKLTNLDHTTPNFFDNSYYKNLLQGDSVLTSDQVLWSTPGLINQPLVLKFAANPWAFAHQFALSTIKMGNISPLTGDEGEIRLNCSVINKASPSSTGSAASLVASQ